MKSNLFLPEKIKVGFNLRSDTYTGALGFVIPYDNIKKEWKQEKAWESWREKYIEETELFRKVEDYNKEQKQKWDDYEDKEINSSYINRLFGTSNPLIIPKELENEPVEGFVINRDGGGRRGWDSRQSFCRIWDPRGFEFEISVENLLYILQYTNSIVGKGIEGKFKYAWDKAKLVLLPINAPEIKEAEEFTRLKGVNLSKKDLVEGYTYKTKSQELFVYLGKFKIHENYWSNKQRDYIYKSNYNYCFYLKNDSKSLKFLTGLGAISELADTNIDSNFITVLEEKENNSLFYPVDGLKIIYEKIDLSKISKTTDCQKRIYVKSRIGYQKIDYSVNLNLSDSQTLYYENNLGSVFSKNKVSTKEGITAREYLESIGGVFIKKEFLINGKERKY